MGWGDGEIKLFYCFQLGCCVKTNKIYVLMGRRDFNLFKKEGMHSGLPDDIVPDISLQIDSFIPKELIADECAGQCLPKSVKWLERAYLLAIIVSTFLCVMVGIDHYTLAIIVVYFLVVPGVMSWWAYRIKMNGILLGAERTTISPLYAATGLMLPVINTLIILPVYQEIWKTSHNPAGWEKVRGSRLILVWWILRLLILLFIFLFGFLSSQFRDVYEGLVGFFVFSLIMVTAVMEAVVVMLSTRAHQAFIDKVRQK